MRENLCEFLMRRGKRDPDWLFSWWAEISLNVSASIFASRITLGCHVRTTLYNTFQHVWIWWKCVEFYSFLEHWLFRFFLVPIQFSLEPGKSRREKNDWHFSPQFAGVSYLYTTLELDQSTKLPHFLFTLGPIFRPKRKSRRKGPANFFLELWRRNK